MPKQTKALRPTRAQGIEAINILGNLPEALRGVYAKLLLATLGIDEIIKRHVRILKSSYNVTGTIPSYISCFSVRHFETWNQFELYYKKIIKYIVEVESIHYNLLAPVSNNLTTFGLNNIFACFVDMLIELQSPHTTRDEMQRMMWNMYDKNNKLFELLVMYVNEEEAAPNYYDSSPAYTAGGTHKKKKTRRPSIKNRRSSKRKSNRTNRRSKKYTSHRRH